MGSGANLQLLVSVPIIPGLNTKYLCRDMKPYVLLMTIRPLDEDFKHDGPLGAFGKSRLMPAPDLTSHSIFLTLHSSLITLHHNTKFTRIHSSLTSFHT